MQVAKYWRKNALRYRLEGVVQHDNYSLQARPKMDVDVSTNHESVIETVKTEKIKVA